MKKNFVKKLALALALVVTATSVNVPAASAAVTPGFKSTAVKVKVGQTKKYNTVNTGKESDKAENRYSVSFKIGKTNIATIKSSKGSKAVKVTGVAEGKTTLRADFKNYATKKVTKVRIPVTVKPAVEETAIKSVTQNSITKLTATFAGDTSAIKTSDFAIVRDYDNAVVAIKSATVDDEDATKVVIETYTTMKDGKTYTVTFSDKSSAQFTATDATVADVNVTPIVVTAAKATDIYVQTLDANGVILSNNTVLNAGNNNLEFTIETTDGYVDGAKLYLTEVGKTAKAKVVYHTWKYDDNGNETGKIVKEFVITAVKDATVISNFKYTIAQNTPAWDSASFKANSTIAASDNGMRAYFNIKDSNDASVEAAYTVASSDTSKLIIDEVQLVNNTTGVDVVGVSAGTAYILLKNADGDTVKTFPVTVLADRKASVLLVDTATFTLSNGANASDVKNVELTVKDQYGVEMNLANAISVVPSVLSKPNGAANVLPVVAATNDTLTFTGTNYAVKGTYVYKVDVTMPTTGGSTVVSRTITVNVQKPTNNIPSSYALVLTGVDANNTVDLAVKANATTAAAVNVNFSVVTKDSTGVLNGSVSNNNVTYTVKHSSGTTLTVSGGAVALTNVNGNIVSVATGVKTGTYTVEANFTVNNVNKKITKVFTVTDTQVAPTVVIKSTDANGVAISTALAPSTNVTYYYDGTAYDGINTGVSVIAVTDKKVTAKGNVFVQYVTIQFPVNGKVDRVITIPVNKTFTNVQ